MQATPSSSEEEEEEEEEGVPPGQRRENWEREIEDTIKLVALLPPSVRAALEQHPDLHSLLEVVMDLGRPPLARFPHGDCPLAETPVSQEDLEYAIQQVGEFGGDNRAGIDRTLHRISCMRNRSGRVVGLTCRVGRAVMGSAELVQDLILGGASILFLGKPGVGKTTAIRELSRLLAGECARRVVIVDTSNEIGGDGDVPHEGIGRARRMQVPDPEQQHRVMIEAVENHMPEAIIIDEIGTEAECTAARTIAQRGVQLIATAHGNELENVVKNPALSDLVGGIQSVTLGDDEAKRRGVQKSILERAAPPTFDVCVEMLERGRWRVHVDVAAAVDALLAGGTAGGQVRERAADGTILKYNYSPSISDQARHSAAASSRSSSGGLPPVGNSSGNGHMGAAGLNMDESLLHRPTPPEGSTFTRRGLWGMNAAAGALDGASGSTSSSRRQRRGRQLGMAGPQHALLRVHAYELDEDKLWEVMTAMALQDKVYLSPTPAGADAVLAVRSRLKTNGGLRAAARDAGVPIYAIKSSSAANLVRAFRTLLGVDPSAGGVFGRSEDEDSDLGVPAASSSGSSSSSSRSRASDDGALGSSGVSNSSGSSSGGVSVHRQSDEEDALEEARLAVEQIVLPLQQPVELLPRATAVRDAQVAMLRRYKLQHEIIGSDQDSRIRILPAAVGASEFADGSANSSSSRLMEGVNVA